MAMVSKAWDAAKLEDLGVSEIPGCVTRCYVMSRCIYINDSKWELSTRIGMVARINRKKREVRFEAMCNQRKRWEQIPFYVAEVLFKGGNGFNQDKPELSDSAYIDPLFYYSGKMEISSTDSGGLEFVLPEYPLKQLGINLKIIGNLPPALILFKYRTSIATSAKYPQLKSSDDVATVLDAFFNVNTTYETINIGYYEKQKADIMSKIKKKEDEILVYERRLDEICNDCAEAINYLGEKYGMEFSF